MKYEVSALLREMAEMLAQRKLVPFFGAGISRQHLGFAAAELAHELAMEINASPQTLLSDIADDYADTRGEAEFVELLRRKLVVTEFDERKAPLHRLLVSLTPNLLYTTNQDNLFELTALRYGRNYRTVVTISDLSESIPGEPLLVKFHGDVLVPESLVFGRRSYQRRMETQDHPLDIKLRADLLGKRLLFLGYSLRDENVARVFATVKRAFGGSMPESYLAAFEDDAALLEVARAYQVKTIVPSCLYPDAQNNAEAFEHFLQDLCDETRKRQVEKGTKDIFSIGPINPRVATDYEVRTAKHAVEHESFETALDTFRTTFDQTQVPGYLQQEVTNLFEALVSRADPADSKHMDGLRGALFNFRLPPEQALTATAAVLAACNRRPAAQAFDSFVSVICPGLPDGSMPVAAAAAIAMLGARHEVITDNFRQLARWWFRDYEKVDERVKEQVISMIKVAWPGHLEGQSPLHRPMASLGLKTGFHEILKDLHEKLPKRISDWEAP